jgi:uncharacterized OsmC-like protein
LEESNSKVNMMNASDLKNLQGPIKEKYSERPEAAMITLRAEGQIGKDISCRIDTGRALVEAGLHPATGGTGVQACSGDMLLEALAACAGVTLKAVSIATGIDVRGGTVRAEGDLDVRGTLGVSKEAAVGFKAIRLSFLLDTSASQAEMETLKKLTERYCVVYQTLSKGVVVESTFINR